MNNGGRRLAMLLCALSMIPCVGPAGAETAPVQELRRVVTGASTRLPTADVDLLRILFEAGARTYWHVHASPQIYLVEAGRGRLQMRGSGILDVDPGEPVYLPANGPHWHGAAPDEAATCLHAYPGGVAITMMEEVTEADYLGGAPAPR